MNPSRPVFQVSQLTEQIKNLLESQFPPLLVEGEISNFRPSGAGHLYFTLKDERAVIQAVMFRRSAAGLRFRPQDGMKVRLEGRLSVYAPRGNYQIIAQGMTLAGEGEILAMLEERKRRLAAEGLFDGDRKQPLPKLPQRIAVVTSPAGAALRDILQVLQRRNAGVGLVILPALVQGEGAGEQLAAQIRRANAYQLGDTLIIGRGGGSLEDLLPFSDERVVRAAAESRIPVISAVGHETDISLTDLAADRRVPTPSAAAEVVADSREEILQRLERTEQQMGDAVRGQLERARLLVDRFSAEEMESRFSLVMQPVMQRLDDQKEQLIRGMADLLRGQRHRLELLEGSLQAYSPLAVLDRGYTLVEDKATGRLLPSVGEMEPGQPVIIRGHDGRAEALVQGRELETRDLGTKETSE